MSSNKEEVFRRTLVQFLCETFLNQTLYLPHDRTFDHCDFTYLMTELRITVTFDLSKQMLHLTISRKLK